MAQGGRPIVLNHSFLKGQEGRGVARKSFWTFKSVNPYNFAVCLAGSFFGKMWLDYGNQEGSKEFRFDA